MKMISSWRRNLILIIFAEIISEIGFGIPTPFVAFYLQELGLPDVNQVAFWVGVIAAGQSIFVALLAPIWGVVGDRYGRKWMLVRAMVGGGLAALGCGLVATAEQFAFVRIIGGALVGAMTASIALMAVITPREHVGRGLGLLQTGMYIGGALGPLAGGLIGGALGYRAAYFFSGFLLVAVGLAVALLVKEDFTRQDRPQETRNPFLITLAEISRTPAVLTAIGLITVSGLGVTISDVFLALFVQTLVPDLGQASAATGLIVSVTTLAYAAGSIVISRSAGRMGRLPVLALCLGIGALSYFPQGFAVFVWQLLAMRTLTGFAIGGVTPLANAVIAETAPQHIQAATYGVAASLNSVGHSLGPPLGSAVVAGLGLAMIFPATGLLLLVAAGLTIAGMRLVKQAAPRL